MDGRSPLVRTGNSLLMAQMEASRFGADTILDFEQLNRKDTKDALDAPRSEDTGILKAQILG